MNVDHVRLWISSPDLDEESTINLCRDVASTLTNDADIETTLATSPAPLNARGDPVTIGAIVLAALTSGSVVALFGVAKAYLERRKSLHFRFERSDGAHMDVQAENLDAAQLEVTLREAKAFFGLTAT